MKKLFFTICFILLNLQAVPANARVQPIVGSDSPQPQINPNLKPNHMPDPANEKEVREFFKKRLENAARSELTDETASANSVNVVHPPEYYEARKESEKSFFEKVYDKAIASLENEDEEKNGGAADGFQPDDETVRSATRFFTVETKEKNGQPQIPTVALTLPGGRRILAPAREHIPYFLSYIDIQANGYVKAEDTIVTVADGGKFAYAMQRVFSKYAADGRRIDFIPGNVTVNGTEIPYTLEEIGNNIVLKPKYNQRLEPGIYTYVFSYMLNNKLVRRDNEVILDWNLFGIPLNTLVTSANAIISLPSGHSFDNAFSVIGSDGRYTGGRANIFRFAGNTVAFSSNTPVLNNEDVHFITEMNKNIFIKDFDGGFSAFLLNWGNIFYALLGLTAVTVSFLLSLIAMKKGRKNNKYNPSYNGSLMRSILVGKFDRTAFTAALLDLYRKGAIDITQNDNRMFLHKNNTGTQKLKKYELKALRYLFPKHAADLEINASNSLPLKKTFHVYAAAAEKQISKFRLMHNIGYVIFSCAMMFLTEIFVSYNSLNFAQTFIILLSSTMLYAFYIWIIMHRFRHWYITLPTKLFSMAALIAIWIFAGIYAGGITSAVILFMVFIIFAFAGIFSVQNNFINEARDAVAQYKEYLQSNADAINLSRDFVNQQSNIFALDITEYFPRNISNKNFYKLDTAENIRQALIGIV